MSEQRESGVEGGVDLPGGAKISGKLKGYRLGDIVMAAAFMFVFVLKPIWDEYRSSAKTSLDVAKMSSEHKALTDSNQRVERSLEDVIYVLTLNEQQRAALNLRMPESLRQRQEWRRNERMEERPR